MPYGVLSTCILTWIAYTALRLLRNYRQACQLRLPTVVVPFSPENTAWVATQMLLKPLFRYLPLDSVSFFRCCRFGWEFKDRYSTHLRLGDAWILVTPEKNWLFVVDVETVSDIFARGRDFIRPSWMYGEYCQILCRFEHFADSMSSLARCLWS